jgi:glycerol-3-phosphate dehydrogenase (NAD(P)+)
VSTDTLHRRARERGANPVVYWVMRSLLQPAFYVYFRMRRTGREHIPADGPVIFAANHRSFLDPFVIGMLIRRPMYYVAKKEIFTHRALSWLLGALGAFPVDRGASDREMIATARAILARGEPVLIFPEGTRTRPGPLGSPRRGVGRLALETGAPVVPVAIAGTEAVRRGWRFRPHRVAVRAGRPLTFPRVENPSAQLARLVTDRIWPCVELQWEWLGGTPPLRRAAVIGAGKWGTAMAALLARAGLEVQLGTRTAEQAERLARRPPGEPQLPAGVAVRRAVELELSEQDLVCFAVPAGALPAAVAALAERIPAQAAVLVGARGLVPPLGTLPAAYVAERVAARAVGVLGGPAHPVDASGAFVVATLDTAFGAQLVQALARAGGDGLVTNDVTGVELAGAAASAAVLAAAAAGPAGGAAAGLVYAEVAAYARTQGGRLETFAGPAGAGELAAGAFAAGGDERRAGELLARGTPARELLAARVPASEVVEAVPLLAERLRRAGVPAPALTRLTGLVEGRIPPERWAQGLTSPARRRRAASAA